jgi:hypothetical protein
MHGSYPNETSQTVRHSEVPSANFLKLRLSPRAGFAWKVLNCDVDPCYYEPRYQGASVLHKDWAITESQSSRAARTVFLLIVRLLSYELNLRSGGDFGQSINRIESVDPALGTREKSLHWSFRFCFSSPSFIPHALA